MRECLQVVRLPCGGLIVRWVVIAVLATSVLPAGFAQAPPADSGKPAAFEVAAIKPVLPDAKASRYITMQGVHRFVVKDYTLKGLIAAAYDLNPQTVLGGPVWAESDPFDITAVTPGETRPSRDQQMAMLRGLLSDRFQLRFHREQKQFSIYELVLAKSGPKLKTSTAPTDEPPKLISMVYPQKIALPARNATMAEFASLLQRAILDRPVVDKTGLTARYDFDLEWAPDETQFGGDVPVAPSDAPNAPLFTALQEQLGLRIVPTRGPVQALWIDAAERPSAD